MSGPFAMTAATSTVKLGDNRQGQVAFTVSTTSGQAIRCRARVVPADALTEKWFSLLGDVERALPAVGTEQYTVRLAVPPAAAPGSYSFRLDVVGVDNPDDELKQGPSV